MKKMMLSFGFMLMLSACSVREAAVIGAIPGRIVGIPLGMAATAVDETFKTTKQVVRANPRYDYSNQVRVAKVNRFCCDRLGRSSGYRTKGDVHFYKAEVLIKTEGPAQIRSMQLLESRDVTDFWQ